TEPLYQEHDASSIPNETRPGTSIRVITGKTSKGTTGPITQPLTDPLYLDVRLEANTEFNEVLPVDHNAFVYVIEGSVTLETEAGESAIVSRDQLAILSDGDSVSLKSEDAGARFLLIAGRPIGESIARGGPFVMNTQAEVKQAFRDYQSGQF
ncbi:MAG: quercetin 2,3-dioxygenase, partial [Gammaproteobacteria bacterium]